MRRKEVVAERRNLAWLREGKEVGMRRTQWLQEGTKSGSLTRHNGGREAR